MDPSNQLTDDKLYQFYPFKFKILITGCCYFLFINYGVFFILPTISLLDLAYLMNTSLQSASNGISLRSFSYCIGSAFCK